MEGCIWTITTRNPNKLPPNTSKRGCGKARVSAVYCQKHYDITNAATIQAGRRQAQREERRRLGIK